MSSAELTGKTSVITRAGSGIGAALASEAFARGMNVVLADVDGSPLRAVAATFPGETVVVFTDVTDLEFYGRLAAKAYDTSGDIHLVFKMSAFRVL